MKEILIKTPPVFWDPIRNESLSLSRELQRKYITLIHRAKEAKVFPDQSEFPVRSSASTKSGKIITGGNAESGFSDTITHGETSLTAVALAKYGKEDPIDTICFYDLQTVEKTYASPCGDCRDKTLYYWGRDLTFLQGNEKLITVSKLSDYLYDGFTAINPTELNPIGRIEAFRALNQSVDVYLPAYLKKKLYGAAIISKRGEKWAAGLYTNAGYDSSSPILNSVIMWRYNNPDVQLDKLVVVGYDFVPSPLYRDRQAFLELDESTSLVTGRQKPLPVELISIDSNANSSSVGYVDGAWVTDSRQWLPYPFSPRDFGMNDALLNQLRNLKLK